MTEHVRSVVDDVVEPRVDALLARLTTDEKIRLLHQHQPAIPRLGMAEFHTGQEAAHGLAWSGTATVFPQPVGLAATWDPDLLERIGTVVGEQAREFHHGPRPQVGLNLWAPVVDLLRDPRAGRNEEGLSEDPHLTGELSTAYCRGLSGPAADGWRTAPTLKHFLAYNNEENRVTTSADVRPRLLHEYYLRAFEPAIRSGAAKAVMLSYNLVNGRPCHLTPYLEQHLRRWNPDLVAVSDAYGPSNLAGEQRYFDDHVTAHAAAIRAGLDSFTDRGADSSFTVETLHGALRDGLVTPTHIDRAVRRLLRLRVRLDSDERDRDDPTEHTLDTDDHRPDPAAYSDPWQGELARQAVRESIVLLRNENQLPLRTIGPNAVSSVAVLGPLIDEVLQDWYSGTPPYRHTPLHAIAAMVPTVRQATGHERIRLTLGGQQPLQDVFELQDWGDGLVALRGSEGRFLTRTQDGALVTEADQPGGWVVQETFRLVRPETPATAATEPTWLEHVATGERYPIEEYRSLGDGVTEAAELAAACDVAIVVVGNHPMIGARETADRTHLDLPDTQRRLVHAVTDANPRTVLVVESSYPYALEEFHDAAPAIVWLAHGGQETGRGLADVLFGEVSPAGRLPQSWYGSSRDLEAIGRIDSYDIISDRRTYLYQSRPPLYPFGHGLGYSEFTYSDLRVEGQPDGSRQLRVEVTNIGDRAAAEVVQFYARRVSPSRVEHPRCRLIGFRRLELAPGETRTASIALEPTSAFAIWDVRQGRFLVEQGRYAVDAGSSPTDLRATVALEPDGEPLLPRLIDRPTRAVDFDTCRAVRLLPDRPMHGDVVSGAAPADTGWIEFHDMDFRVLDDSTAVLVARASGPGRLRLHAGTKTNALATVDLTDEDERLARVHCAPPSAIADIRIALEGSARLAEFWFERSRPS